VQHTKIRKIYLSDHKIYEIAIKNEIAVQQTERPQNLPTPFLARHSKIYLNWDFWFENIPSGNPGQRPEVGKVLGM
jgi:hypothetical protein